MSDRLGTGYNAYQSTIAVGSGQITGKEWGMARSRGSGFS